MQKQSRQWRRKHTLLSCSAWNTERKRQPLENLKAFGFDYWVKTGEPGLSREQCFGPEVSSEKGFFKKEKYVIKKYFLWFEHKPQQLVWMYCWQWLQLLWLEKWQKCMCLECFPTSDSIRRHEKGSLIWKSKGTHRLFCSSLPIQISAKENVNLCWLICDAHWGR